MTKTNDAFVFLPLGGTGEIGMNCNLFGYGPEGFAQTARKWIMVDLGITFPGPQEPGIEAIMPDTSFMEARRKDLLGLFLTHGHEDHIGAVAHLWPRLQCPIYATPFTAALVKRKLAEAGLLEAVDINIVPLGGRVSLGPFEVDYIGLTHSIAEPNALAIRCDDICVLHTGDWKIDDAPQIGDVTEADKLVALGDAGVDAIVCDSTNVLSAGRSGSEAEVAQGLIETIQDKRGRVLVTTFASNVGRLASIGRAAQATGRHITLLGRGMHRMYEVAREAGYLQDFPPLVSDEEAAYLPPDKLLVLCTGSQGEPRAALARIAAGRHPHLVMEPGDCVIFSSKIIPGNEVEIFALHNQLAQHDIEVITARGTDLHVSGHPNREELVDMYGWVRPRVAIPVHGEHRHLIAHAALAGELGVPEPMRIHNGDLVQIAPGPASVIDVVPTGRYYLDGRLLGDREQTQLSQRRRLSFGGYVHISIARDAGGRIMGSPDVGIVGLPETDGQGVAMTDWILDAVERGIPSKGRVEPKRAGEEIRQRVRREVDRIWGKKPMVEVRFLSV